jgi:O-antigen/teichoic acid export membrane protein
MLRHTLNHLGVVAASKVMPLASLLIYSRFLEPAEYGVVSLFVSYIWVFGILLTLNMHTAIGRFIYDRAINMGELIGTSMLPIGLLFIVGILFAMVNNDSVARFLNLPSVLLPLLFMVAAGQIAESLLVQVLTAREQSGHLLLIIALRSCCALLATIAMFYVMRTDRYLAVLYAEGFTSVLLTVYVLLSFWRNRPWTFSIKTFYAFANYSIPLIPYMLSLTLLSQLDRIMIDRLFDKEATGLYSVGYNLGILLVMVAGALLNALNPRFFSAMDDKRYDEVIRDASAIFIVCTFCAFLLVLFGPVISSFFIPEKYSSGLALIPLVALGGLVSVVFQVWGRVIGYFKKTYLLSIIAVAATVIKILLNILLLPEFGIFWGAVTTVVAYGFMAVSVVVIIKFNHAIPRVPVMSEMIWLGLLAWLIIIDHIGWWQLTSSMPVRILVMIVASIFLMNSLLRIIKIKQISAPDS